MHQFLPCTTLPSMHFFYYCFIFLALSYFLCHFSILSSFGHSYKLNVACLQYSHLTHSISFLPFTCSHTLRFHTPFFLPSISSLVKLVHANFTICTLNIHCTLQSLSLLFYHHQYTNDIQLIFSFHPPNFDSSITECSSIDTFLDDC